MSAGELNYYSCDRCKRVVVTVDLVEGVTPAFMSCDEPNVRRMLPGGVIAPACKGTLASGWYPPPDRWPADVPRIPGFEWYRPATRELPKLSQGEQYHVENGGLLLRRAITMLAVS